MTKRIEFIDALRGFTMILVVFFHVGVGCWHIDGLGVSFHDFFLQFRMPMFFFISGFVMYKANVKWNASYILQFLRRKFPVQIVSTLIFFTLFVYINKMNYVDTLFLTKKGGYWFTYTLFEYYIIYALLRFIFRKHEDLIVLFSGLFFYIITWDPLYRIIPLSPAVKSFLGIPQWTFFFFFCLGTLTKKHYTKITSLLDGKWIMTIAILIYFMFNVFKEDLQIKGVVFNILVSCTGIICLFQFFRKYELAFRKEKKIGYALQYIGKRTLDIYLIHFFLIPKGLSFIHVFTEHPMPVIEATVSLLISLVIIAFSLIIGNIIRLSPIFSHYLFGTKKESIELSS